MHYRSASYEALVGAAPTFLGAPAICLVKQFCLGCFHCLQFSSPFWILCVGIQFPQGFHVCALFANLQDVQGPRIATRSWLLCTSIVSFLHVSTSCTSPITMGIASSSGIGESLISTLQRKVRVPDMTMRLKYTQKETFGTDMASVVVTVGEDYDLMHGPEV